jgi:hypothetical protein
MRSVSAGAGPPVLARRATLLLGSRAFFQVGSGKAALTGSEACDLQKI